MSGTAAWRTRQSSSPLVGWRWTVTEGFSSVTLEQTGFAWLVSTGRFPRTRGRVNVLSEAKERARLLRRYPIRQLSLWPPEETSLYLTAAVFARLPHQA